jgi:hypothetical protein
MRDERNEEETHALLTVNEDLKGGCAVAEEEKRKAKKQREWAETSVHSFEKMVTDSK